MGSWKKVKPILSICLHSISCICGFFTLILILLIKVLNKKDADKISLKLIMGICCAEFSRTLNLTLRDFHKTDGRVCEFVAWSLSFSTILFLCLCFCLTLQFHTSFILKEKIGKWWQYFLWIFPFVVCCSLTIPIWATGNYGKRNQTCFYFNKSTNSVPTYLLIISIISPSIIVIFYNIFVIIFAAIKLKRRLNIINLAIENEDCLETKEVFEDLKFRLKKICNRYFFYCSLPIIVQTIPTLRFFVDLLFDKYAFFDGLGLISIALCGSIAFIFLLLDPAVKNVWYYMLGKEQKEYDIWEISCLIRSLKKT